VAHTVQDDGFHEIQLNGKQLVFLFMAATVVSVVIFLCGVLVGRGVRAERVSSDATPVSGADTTPQPAPAPPTQPPAGSDPTTAAAPPATEDLSYFSRLEKSKAPAEQLKPASSADRTPARAPVEKAPPEKAAAEKASSPQKAPVEKAPVAATTRAAAPAAAPASTPPAAPPAQPARPEPPRQADATSGEPSGQGFAVQIAALNVRSEADAIARRLSSKGYAAYVISPANGTPAVYRVRVGKFPTRREAETVAAKLQKEEQFKPWVTR
jgi:cell division septation protein DedD